MFVWKRSKAVKEIEINSELSLHLRHKGLSCKNAFIKTEPMDISSKYDILEFRQHIVL